MDFHGQEGLSLNRSLGSEKSSKFLKPFFDHFESSVVDHTINGRAERLTRNLKEQLYAKLDKYEETIILGYPKVVCVNGKKSRLHL